MAARDVQDLLTWLQDVLELLVQASRDLLTWLQDVLELLVQANRDLLTWLQDVLVVVYALATPNF